METNFSALRDEAKKTALRWLDSDNVLVIDTETTGLDNDAEIVEISVLNLDGAVVFDSLVKPKNQIPAGASAIHGITNEDVKNAPTFADIAEQIQDIFRDHLVLIYNAPYDLRLLRQSSKLSGIDDAWVDGLNADCVMMLYSRFDGEVRYNGELRWHKLTSASTRFGYVSEAAHRAKADCLMTIAVIEGVANDGKTH